MKSVKRFFAGVWTESKKISWPTRATVIAHTIIVLISSVVAMATVAAIDYGLSSAVKYFVSLG